VFSSVAAIQSDIVETYGRMAGEAEPRKLVVELVSGTYFPTLGVNAIFGRALMPWSPLRSRPARKHDSWRG
jgi:hypothetical protein